MKKYYYWFFFLVFFNACGINKKGTAYINDPKNTTKEDNKLVNECISKAKQQLSNNNISEAIACYRKALDIDPQSLSVLFALSPLLIQTNDIQGALQLHQTILNIDSVSAPILYFWIARDWFMLNDVNKAQIYMRAYAAHTKQSKIPYEVTQLQHNIDFALSMATKHPYYIGMPINVGSHINTKNDEYYPFVPIINDSVLYFTRKEEKVIENLYRSQLMIGGMYALAQRTNRFLDSFVRKGAASISQDGEMLVYALKDLDGFNIYYSIKTLNGWSAPINAGTGVNTAYWESSPSLSPDKKTMYFSSNRPGGYGGRDVYMSEFKNNHWAQAINMGSHINTVGDEIAPYMHSDNQTLFFTSNGLPGYGGADIFITRKDSNNIWGIPENIGYPINTPFEDATPMVEPDGKTILFSSNRPGGMGGLDIYRASLPSYAQVLPTDFIKGIVVNIESKKGIGAHINLLNSNHSGVLSVVESNDSGHFFLTVLYHHSYTLLIHRVGYFFSFYSFNSDVALAQHQVKPLTIMLRPIKVNDHITLDNVYFANNSYQILDSSIEAMLVLRDFLIENPSAVIEVGGYTDSIGNVNMNLILSENRAKAVVNYLITLGIDPARLFYKGYGDLYPISTNGTEEGRAKNRRTEYKVLKL